MFEPVYDDIEGMNGALIKVIGIGGGGGNAVDHMVKVAKQKEEMLNPDFPQFSAGQVIYYSVNTDIKALRQSSVPNTIQIGRGLGAGGKPEIARLAAEAEIEGLKSMLEGADMVFIAAGMGGGTGTGAAPVIAKIAKELGILTVAVVTKPFSFEGRVRDAYAKAGIQELSKYVDSLLIVPNDKLKTLGKSISLISAFAAANDVLCNAVNGISDMITSPGLIGVDFADVKTVMSEMGRAMMGTGVAKGEVSDGRAIKAAQEAVASPLLEDVDLSGAKGVLVNITAGMDLGLDEFYEVGDTIRSFADDSAMVIIGTTLVPDMTDEIRVTIVATGLGDNEQVALSPVSPINIGGSGTNQTPQGLNQESQGQPAGPTKLGDNVFSPTKVPGFLNNK